MDLKHTLRYLKGIQDDGFQYEREASDNLILAYCDSDFADHSGYIICIMEMDPYYGHRENKLC